MNKEAYYFSHDSNAHNDEKIIKLRFKLGYEGYGIYWALIECLRDANAFRLQCDYSLIAYNLQCDIEKLKSVIEDFGLFQIDNNFFFSESLNKRMSLKEAKSEKARQSALARWNKSEDANALQTHSERNASKVKESKLNRKENINIPGFLNTPEIREALINWLDLMDVKGNIFTDYQMDLHFKDLLAFGTPEVALQAIDDAIKGGWKSFHEPREYKQRNNEEEANAQMLKELREEGRI